MGLLVGDRVRDDIKLDRFFGGTDTDLFTDIGAIDLVNDFDTGEFVL